MSFVLVTRHCPPKRRAMLATITTDYEFYDIYGMSAYDEPLGGETRWIDQY